MKKFISLCATSALTLSLLATSVASAMETAKPSAAMTRVGGSDCAKLSGLSKVRCLRTLQMKANKGTSRMDMMKKEKMMDARNNPMIRKLTKRAIKDVERDRQMKYLKEHPKSTWTTSSSSSVKSSSSSSSVSSSSSNM